MQKFLVIIPGEPPEIVEADSFSVDESHILRFLSGDRESAAFVHWAGVKEAADKLKPAAV